MHRVVLFGELLMRLATSRHERFVQAEHFEVTYAGGEANVGVVLVNCGAEAVLVSAVPENDIGQACINQMRRYGLDTAHVQRRGTRLGIYFLETGAGQRPSKVVYDRAGSSFTQLQRGEVPWRQILGVCNWFHFTGTPALLSSELAELTAEGCKVANELGVPVSCDLNYRSTLATLEHAQQVMGRLVPLVDLLVVNEEHARQVLGAPPFDVDRHDRFEPQGYAPTTTWLRQNYKLSQVALTIRSGASASENRIAGLLDDGHSLFMSRSYTMQVVDRIGGGDAFCGGLIYGLLEGWPGQRTVEFAAAAAGLKHTIHGDFCHVSRAEIEALAEHGGSGRMVR